MSARRLVLLGVLAALVAAFFLFDLGQTFFNSHAGNSNLNASPSGGGLAILPARR